MAKEKKVPNNAAYAQQSKSLTKLSKKTAKFAMKGAKASQARATEQFDSAKADYAANKATTDKIVSSDIDLMETQSEWAKADRERHASQFQPLEDALVEKAWNYDSAARRDMEMGRQSADVAQKFDAQREAATQQLEGYGIDPSSTRFAALDLDFRTKRAAAQAAAANEGARQVEDKADAYRTQAIELGLNYPKFADTASDSSVAAGTAANDAMNKTTAVGYDTMGTAPQHEQLGVGYTNAATGATSAAGRINSDAQKNNIAAFNASEAASTDWGEIAGMAAGIGAKAYFGAEGGAIPDPEAGGDVQTPGGAIPPEASASGGEEIDDVDAKLTAGEFVIPVDVVKWKGEEFFQKLIEQARTRKDGASAKPEEKMTEVGPPTFQSTPSALPAR